MQNPKNNWARVGVFAALVSICLGLVCAWLYETEERDKRTSNAGTEMERARNRDTSNFDNVLHF
jgi:ABC-type transporter Mla subunit MlaD